MARDVGALLSDASVLAVLCMASEWPRRLFRAATVPIGWKGLLERSDGGRRRIAAGEEPDAQERDTLFLVREGTMRFTFGIGSCRTSDGHEISGVCEVEARIGDGEDELAGARRAFMGRGIPLRAGELGAEFAAKGGADAVQSRIRGASASEIMEEERGRDVRAPLIERMGGFLFDAGLHLASARLAPTSETYNRQKALERETRERLERMATRDALEQAALEATRRRMEQLRGLLNGVPTESEKSAQGNASASTDDVAAGDTSTTTSAAAEWSIKLAAMSPTERSRVLENLWRISPSRRKARSIVVVAGGECLWIDPQRSDSISRRVTIPDQLGPLRSVSYDVGEDCLLIGAALGVWVVGARDGELMGSYRVSQVERSRTGFNAAIVVERRVVATHSHLGCWSWRVGDPGDARCLFSPGETGAKSVRGLTHLDRGFVLAADDSLRVHDGSGEARGVVRIPGELRGTTDVMTRMAVTDEGARLVSGVSPPSIMATRVSRSPGSSGGAAAILCACVHEGAVYVGTGQGLVLAYRPQDGEPWSLVRRGVEPVESVLVRRWGDVLEVVLAAGSQGIIGVYPQQDVVCPMLTADVSLRRVWAADDVMVAVSDARDRLYVMSGNSPERMGREVPIGRWVGRSVQDVSVVASE